MSVTPFGIAKHISNQASLEAAAVLVALGPLNVHVTEAIRGQKPNSICRLSDEWMLVASEIEKLSVYASIFDKSEAELWGVRLSMGPCVDQGVSKAWIKKAHLWHRILSVAGNETEIGYKEVTRQVHENFNLAFLGQIPYNTFNGNEALLFALGPSARQALEEAVVVENEFNPREWDSDGYYLGPP